MPTQSITIDLPGKRATIASDTPEVFTNLARLMQLSEDTRQPYDFRIEHTGASQWQLWRQETLLHTAQSVDEVLITLYGNIYEWYVPSSQYFLLHSGVIAKKGRGVLIIGEQECGKSTLTSVALTEGWCPLSDDVGVVDTKTMQCHLYPRNLLIRPKTLELNPYIRDAIEIQCVLDVYGDTAYASRPRIAQHVRSTSIDLIVFPQWSEQEKFSQITAGEAAIRMMDNSLNLRHLGYTGVKMATALARSCPAYKLEVKDPLDAIRSLEHITLS